MAQFKREKRDVSGWIVLNKPSERCQNKCLALIRFGNATNKNNEWLVTHGTI